MKHAMGWALSLALLAGCAKDSNGKGSSVSYHRVEPGDLMISTQATGQVQPQNRVEVKSPVSGRVEEVLVREGDWVKKGSTVALISGSDRAALLDAARAKGPDELKRWEELYRPTPLLAPVSGLVVARNVEPGRNITLSDALLALSDRLVVLAQVDETDIAQIKVGQDARLTLDAYPGQAIAARVVHVAYEARTVSNVTVYDVEVLPLRAPSTMRSGMTANVDFISEQRLGVLWVPRQALSQDSKAQGGRGGAYVTLSPNAQGQALTRAVKLGMREADRVEVKDGLAEGDWVAVPELRLPESGQAGSNPFMPQRPRTPRGGGGGGGARSSR